MDYEVEKVPMRSYGHPFEVSHRAAFHLSDNTRNKGDKPREFMALVPRGLLPAMEIDGKVTSANRVVCLRVMPAWGIEGVNLIGHDRKLGHHAACCSAGISSFLQGAPPVLFPMCWFVNMVLNLTQQFWQASLLGHEALELRFTIDPGLHMLVFSGHEGGCENREARPKEGTFPDPDRPMSQTQTLRLGGLQRKLATVSACFNIGFAVFLQVSSLRAASGPSCQAALFGASALWSLVLVLVPCQGLHWGVGPITSVLLHKLIDARDAEVLRCH